LAISRVQSVLPVSQTTTSSANDATLAKVCGSSFSASRAMMATVNRDVTLGRECADEIRSVVIGILSLNLPVAGTSARYERV
jgi:hypothetical protein